MFLCFIGDVMKWEVGEKSVVVGKIGIYFFCIERKIAGY